MKTIFIFFSVVVSSARFQDLRQKGYDNNAKKNLHLNLHRSNRSPAHPNYLSTYGQHEVKNNSEKRGLYHHKKAEPNKMIENIKKVLHEIQVFLLKNAF